MKTKVRLLASLVRKVNTAETLPDGLSSQHGHRTRLEIVKLISDYSEYESSGELVPVHVAKILRLMESTDPQFIMQVILYTRTELRYRTLACVLAVLCNRYISGHAFARSFYRKMCILISDVQLMVACSVDSGRVRLPLALKSAIKWRLETAEAEELRSCSPVVCGISIRDIILLTHPRMSPEVQAETVRLLKRSPKKRKLYLTHSRYSSRVDSSLKYLKAEATTGTEWPKGWNDYSLQDYQTGGRKKGSYKSYMAAVDVMSRRRKANDTRYWKEFLERDGDINIMLANISIIFRRGLYEEAGLYFERCYARLKENRLCMRINPMLFYNALEYGMYLRDSADGLSSQTIVTLMLDSIPRLFEYCFSSEDDNPCYDKTVIIHDTVQDLYGGYIIRDQDRPYVPYQGQNPLDPDYKYSMVKSTYGLSASYSLFKVCYLQACMAFVTRVTSTYFIQRSLSRPVVHASLNLPHPMTYYSSLDARTDSAAHSTKFGTFVSWILSHKERSVPVTSTMGVAEFYETRPNFIKAEKDDSWRKLTAILGQVILNLSWEETLFSGKVNIIFVTGYPPEHANIALHNLESSVINAVESDVDQNFYYCPGITIRREEAQQIYKFLSSVDIDLNIVCATDHITQRYYDNQMKAYPYSELWKNSRIVRNFIVRRYPLPMKNYLFRQLTGIAVSNNYSEILNRIINTRIQ